MYCVKVKNEKPRASRVLSRFSYVLKVKSMGLEEPSLKLKDLPAVSSQAGPSKK